MPEFAASIRLGWDDGESEAETMIFLAYFWKAKHGLVNWFIG